MARGYKTPGSGRKPGTGNKALAPLRDLIREALDRAGGVAYLAKMAEKNPQVFGQLVGRLIPQEVRNTGAIAHIDLSKATDEELEQLERVLAKLGGQPSDAR